MPWTPSEAFSGTPVAQGIGNVQFERFWNLANDPESRGWFRMRIPDGASPKVPATDILEARRSYSEAAVRQSLFAEFLSDAGAVFSNLDRVFVLKALPKDHPDTAWIPALRARYSMPSMAWWVSEAAPQAGHIYGASIDWARSPQGDYSAMTVFDFSTGNQVLLARWRGEDFTGQMEIVLAVQKHYGAQQLHSDENGMGNPMSDFMRRRHALGFVGHRFGAQSKGDYVRRAQVLFVDSACRSSTAPSNATSSSRSLPSSRMGWEARKRSSTARRRANTTTWWRRSSSSRRR